MKAITDWAQNLRAIKTSPDSPPGTEPKSQTNKYGLKISFAKSRKSFLYSRGQNQTHIEIQGKRSDNVISSQKLAQ